MRRDDIVLICFLVTTLLGMSVAAKISIDQRTLAPALHRPPETEVPNDDDVRLNVPESSQAKEADDLVETDSVTDATESEVEETVPPVSEDTPEEETTEPSETPSETTSDTAAATATEQYQPEEEPSDEDNKVAEPDNSENEITRRRRAFDDKTSTNDITWQRHGTDTADKNPARNINYVRPHQIPNGSKSKLHRPPNGGAAIDRPPFPQGSLKFTGGATVTKQGEATSDRREALKKFMNIVRPNSSRKTTGNVSSQLHLKLHDNKRVGSGGSGGTVAGRDSAWLEEMSQQKRTQRHPENQTYKLAAATGHFSTPSVALVKLNAVKGIRNHVSVATKKKGKWIKPRDGIAETKYLSTEKIGVVRMKTFTSKEIENRLKKRLVSSLESLSDKKFYVSPDPNDGLVITLEQHPMTPDEIRAHRPSSLPSNVASNIKLNDRRRNPDNPSPADTFNNVQDTTLPLETKNNSLEDFVLTAITKDIGTIKSVNSAAEKNASVTNDGDDDESKTSLENSALQQLKADDNMTDNFILNPITKYIDQIKTTTATSEKSATVTHNDGSATGLKNAAIAHHHPEFKVITSLARNFENLLATTESENTLPPISTAEIPVSRSPTPAAMLSAILDDSVDYTGNEFRKLREKVLENLAKAKLRAKNESSLLIDHTVNDYTKLADEILTTLNKSNSVQVKNAVNSVKSTAGERVAVTDSTIFDLNSAYSSADSLEIVSTAQPRVEIIDSTTSLVSIAIQTYELKNGTSQNVTTDALVGSPKSQTGIWLQIANTSIESIPDSTILNISKNNATDDLGKLGENVLNHSAQTVSRYESPILINHDDIQLVGDTLASSNISVSENNSEGQLLTIDNTAGKQENISMNLPVITKIIKYGDSLKLNATDLDQEIDSRSTTTVASDFTVSSDWSSRPNFATEKSTSGYKMQSEIIKELHTSTEQKPITNEAILEKHLIGPSTVSPIETLPMNQSNNSNSQSIPYETYGKISSFSSVEATTRESINSDKDSLKSKKVTFDSFALDQHPTTGNKNISISTISDYHRHKSTTDMTTLNTQGTQRSIGTHSAELQSTTKSNAKIEDLIPSTSERKIPTSTIPSSNPTPVLPVSTGTNSTKDNLKQLKNLLKDSKMANVFDKLAKGGNSSNLEAILRRMALQISPIASGRSDQNSIDKSGKQSTRKMTNFSESSPSSTKPKNASYVAFHHFSPPLESEVPRVIVKETVPTSFNKSKSVKL